MKRWPLNKTWFWERVPFFRILLPLVAGITAYEYSWLRIPALHVFVLLVLGLTSYVITALVPRRTHGISLVNAILLHAFLFLSGWIVCYQNDIKNDSRWFGHRIADSEAFVVSIKNDPAEKDRTWKLEVNVLNGIDSKQVHTAKGNAFLYIYKDGHPLPYKRGDTLLVNNQFIPIRNSGNPFEFDYARYCARNNIYYQTFIPVTATTLYGGSKKSDLSFADQAHIWCADRLRQHVKDTITLGLLQAILIGENVNLDNDLRQAYSETGIVHIIAISGSHISFFFFIIALLFSWVKNRKYKWLQYFIALPLIWFYVLMAGAPPSAVRAAMMFSILGIGFSLQKTGSSLNYLLAAAVLLLCAEPMWIFSAGFQLSFVAVLSLVLFYSPIYKLASPTNKITRLLWEAIAASLAAELLIAPLVIYYFHLFPVSFIVANLAAYFFMGVVMIAGMLIIILSFIPAVASVLATITMFVVHCFNYLVGWFQQLNPESFTYLILSGAELVILYLTIFGIAVFILNKKKAGIYIGLAAFGLLIALLCSNEWKALHQEKLVVYNVNRVNHTELIRGKQYQVLKTDSNINKKSKYYSIKPAHTGWKANEQAKVSANRNLIVIGGRKVLLLDEPPSNHQKMDVDYLIVGYTSKKTEVQRLKTLFSPEKMVIGSNYNRRRTAEWKETCKELGIPLHATSIDGAFILESL